MSQACILNAIRTFRFEGHLNSAKCLQIEDDLRKSLAQSEAHVVFDLSEVDLISSSFLRLCMYVRENAGAHGFQVVNVDPEVRKAFQVAGLADMLSD